MDFEVGDRVFLKVFPTKGITRFGMGVSLAQAMIIGCLSKYQAQIDCLKQKITLRGPSGEKIVHKGKLSGSGVRLITTIIAQKLVKRDCKG